MPLDFPTSPTLNQTYSFGTKNWKWNGYAWVNTGSTFASGGTGTTGPTGATGAGYTAAGLSGGFLWISPVDSFGIRGASFNIGYVLGSTGPTGPVDAYVRTFNGRTGDVQGVTSINGATGAISNVAFTNNGNTFSVLQFMNAGISSSGGMTTDTLNIISGFTANGVTGTIGTLIAFTGLSASQLTGVSAALYATSPTNTLDITSTSSDGVGLRISTTGQARTGAIRLGKSTTQSFNTLIESSSGVFSIFNGISNTYSNMLSLTTSGLTTSNISGVTFTGLVKANSGLSASGGITFNSRVNAYSGICGSGGITFSSQINAIAGVSAAGITSDNGYKISSSAINSQTTNYILVATDNGKIITMNAASGITLTVPTGLPVGYTTTVIRLGSGNVGISAALGVSINSFQNQVNIAGQHAAVSLISYTTDTFNLAGGLTG